MREQNQILVGNPIESMQLGSGGGRTVVLQTTHETHVMLFSDFLHQAGQLLKTVEG